MAATVGATLTGASFPLRHSGLGPYESSGGNTYWFGRDGATNIGNARCWKASDPTSAFTAQTAKLMSSGATVAIEAMGAYQVGNVVHVATQIATGVVYYNAYTMDTDTWSLATSETVQSAAATTFAPVSGRTFVSLVVRSSGNVVFTYAGGVTVMSGTFNTCYYRERTGVATYGTATKYDNGGSIDWQGGKAVLGATNRVHFFFTDGTNGLQYQRTLSAANALETFPASFTTGAGGSSVALNTGVSYSYLGNTRANAAILKTNVTSLLPTVHRLDSADAPTVSSVSAGDNTGTVAANNSLMGLAAASATLHLLYVPSGGGSIYHDFSTDGGATWGTDVNELTVTNAQRITTNTYTRSGNTVLGFVYDENATAIKYAEIALAAAPAAQKPRMYTQPATVLYY